MRYGSVCSGIEAATVAWNPLGWTPAFFSEIEKFPSAVLGHHYGSNMPGEPNATNGVPNYGDMTNFKEAPMIDLTYADDQIGWYAILTPPQREQRVVEWLAMFGIYSFYPVKKKWRVRRTNHRPLGAKSQVDGRTGHYVDSPILSGYVFAKFSGMPRWHIIKDMPHISGVLGHMGNPICLAYEDLKNLHDLRRRVTEMDEQAAQKPVIVFRPGETVRVTETGAMDGFIREVTKVEPDHEIAYLDGLDLLGKPVAIPYAMLAHV